MNRFIRKFEDFRQLFSANLVVKKYPLGKYPESNKSAFQIESWQRAITDFQNNRWPEVAIAVLDSILGDSKSKGDYKKNEDGTYEFIALHGSVVIHGHINNDEMLVESYILQANELRPSLTRKLLEMNTQLDYSKFSLNDESEITLSFRLAKYVAPPISIYDSLKEVALLGDSNDSRLAYEFHHLDWLGNEHLIPENDDIITLKTNKLHAELVRWDAIMELTHSVTYVADDIRQLYIDLGFLYNIDFLISPKNYLQYYILQSINYYWEQKQELERAELAKYLEDRIRFIENYNPDTLKAEFFRAPYLFTSRNNMDRTSIFQLVINHRIFLSKYINQMDDIGSTAVIHFVLGSIIFHYDIPVEWIDWIYCMYAVIEPEYISAMDILPEFTIDYGTEPRMSLIVKWLEEAINKSKKTPYPLPNLPESPDLTNSTKFILEVLNEFML